MTSSIDATKPTDAVIYVGDLRNNFLAAKTEIGFLHDLALQVELYRGAHADDAAGNAAMFQAAIDAANAAGGGTVYYARAYVCAKLFLKTGVCLYGAHYLLNFRGNLAADDHGINIVGNRITLWQVRAEIDTTADAIVKPSGAINDLLIDDCDFSSDVATGNIFALVNFQDQATKRVTCRNTRFHDARIGFYCNGSVPAANTAFEDIFFIHNLCWNLRSENFGINSPGTVGLGAKRIIVSGNTFRDTADNVGAGSFAVISLAGVSDAIISENLIDGFAAGIWLEDECERINIHHNTIRRSIASILVNSNDRVLAVHNACRWSQFCNNIIENVTNPGGAAIHIAIDSTTSSFGWKVNENIIRNITGTGINVSSSGGSCEVKSNLLIDIGDRGIAFFDNVNVIDNVVNNAADWAYRFSGAMTTATAKFEGNLAQNMPTGIDRLRREGGTGGLVDLNGACHRMVPIVAGVSAYEPFFLANQASKGDLLITAWLAGSEYVLDVPVTYSPTLRWQTGTAYTNAQTNGTNVTGIEIQTSGTDGHLRIRVTGIDQTVNLKAELRGFIRL